MKIKRLLLSVPFFGLPLLRFTQWLCGRITGHAPGSDWGYSLDGSADVWCKWCDGMYQVPADEFAKINPAARKLTWELTGKDMGRKEGQADE